MPKIRITLVVQIRLLQILNLATVVQIFWRTTGTRKILKDLCYYGFLVNLIGEPIFSYINFYMLIAHVQKKSTPGI